MILRTRCLLIVFATCLAVAQAHGQEGQPSAAPGAPGGTAASGPENKYANLTHSKDSKVRGTAERYLNLVRFQEWGGATGKTQMAKYVSHDPDLKHVRLSVARGTGKDRVVKDFDVEVDKLNKTCQARVKQIDVLQKHLDEMIANGADKPDAMAGQTGPEGPGVPPGNNRYANTRNRRNTGPNADREGARPEQAAATAGPEAGSPHPGATTPSTSPESDPSAAEPDPIGFGDLPPSTPGAPLSVAPGPGPTAPGPGATTPEIPGNVIPSGAPSSGTVPTHSDLHKPWQTDFEAFRGNFKVYPIGPGQPPAPTDRKLVRVWEGSPTQHTAEWDIDFGELDDLRSMAGAMEVMMGSPRSSLSRPEFQQKFKDSEDAKKRIGEVTWEATFRKFNGATQPIELIFPALPKPLQIMSMLDADASTPEQWSSFVRGDRIRFKGRLSMSNADLIRLNVREPVKVGVSEQPAR